MLLSLALCVIQCNTLKTVDWANLNLPSSSLGDSICSSLPHWRDSYSPDISPGSLAWVGDGDEKLGAWGWKMLSSGFAHALVRCSQSMGL